MLALLPADAKVPAKLALLVEGRYGGARWLVLSSPLPLDDAGLAPLTGGRPLDVLRPDMAALVVRMWLEKIVGGIQNFSVDSVATAPVKTLIPDDLAVRMPIRITAPQWRADLLFMCESTLELAGLAAQFVTPAEPRLPAELRVQVSLSVGKIEVAVHDVEQLSPGDVVIFDELPQPACAPPKN